MNEEENSKISCNGCGCVGCLIEIILFLLVGSFFISFCKNCSGRTIEESVVVTTKDYYQTADSIWNK